MEQMYPKIKGQSKKELVPGTGKHGAKKLQKNVDRIWKKGWK